MVSGVMEDLRTQLLSRTEILARNLLQLVRKLAHRFSIGLPPIGIDDI